MGGRRRYLIRISAMIHVSSPPQPCLRGIEFTLIRATTPANVSVWAGCYVQSSFTTLIFLSVAFRPHTVLAPHVSSTGNVPLPPKNGDSLRTRNFFEAFQRLFFVSYIHDYEYIIRIINKNLQNWIYSNTWKIFHYTDQSLSDDREETRSIRRGGGCARAIRI